MEEVKKHRIFNSIKTTFRIKYYTLKTFFPPAFEFLFNMTFLEKIIQFPGDSRAIPGLPGAVDTLYIIISHMWTIAAYKHNNID